MAFLIHSSKSSKFHIYHFSMVVQNIGCRRSAWTSLRRKMLNEGTVIRRAYIHFIIYMKIIDFSFSYFSVVGTYYPIPFICSSIKLVSNLPPSNPDCYLSHLMHLVDNTIYKPIIVKMLFITTSILLYIFFTL